jgi:hypothetical protein
MFRAQSSGLNLVRIDGQEVIPITTVIPAQEESYLE